MLAPLTALVLACHGPDARRAATAAGRPDALRDTALQFVPGTSPGPHAVAVAPDPGRRLHLDVPGGDTVAAEMRQWTAAAVDTVLQRAGATRVVQGGVVRQPFLAVPGTRFTFDRGEIQVYTYGDAVARGRDTDPLDSARAAPPTMQVLWRMPPTLITNNNLVAILLTRDTALRDRIAQRITGHDRTIGAAVTPSPQPPGPRRALP